MLRALANRARIDTDLAALQDAIAHIEGNLLDEESMEVNLGYFYKLEKPSHVRLVRLNQLATTPPEAKGIFNVVPFSMQVAGSYRNTMNSLPSPPFRTKSRLSLRRQRKTSHGKRLIRVNRPC